MNTMTAPQAQNKTERRVTVHPVTLPRVVRLGVDQAAQLAVHQDHAAGLVRADGRAGGVTAAVTASQWSRLPPPAGPVSMRSARC